MKAGAAPARTEAWLALQFSAPKPDYPRLVRRVIENPDLITALTNALNSTSASLKFGSAKALSLVAETAPHLLYPRFDFFFALLDSPNSILRWNAIRTLASLAPADSADRWNAALERFLSIIPGPNLIDAANAIAGSARIAAAKPSLADRLARGILSVQRASYKTDECRNVAIGHAIESLDRFFPLIIDTDQVIAFVRAQLENRRPATRKKAAAFLKKRCPQKAAHG